MCIRDSVCLASYWGHLSCSACTLRSAMTQCLVTSMGKLTNNKSTSSTNCQYSTNLLPSTMQDSTKDCNYICRLLVTYQCNRRSFITLKPQTSLLPHRVLYWDLCCSWYLWYLDDDINSNILKFADDTKIFRGVRNSTDCNQLQADLDKLVLWTQKRQTEFNVDKCRVCI